MCVCIYMCVCVCGIQISKQREAQFGLYFFISRNRFNPYKLSAIEYGLYLYNKILHAWHWRGTSL